MFAALIGFIALATYFFNVQKLSMTIQYKIGIGSVFAIQFHFRTMWLRSSVEQIQTTDPKEYHTAISLVIFSFIAHKVKGGIKH